jgi:hypothetical protein
MKITKTNLALIVALLSALIAPQAMEVSLEPFKIMVNDDGMLTLTANRNVTWLVLEDVDYQVIDRNLILAKPVRVIAISNSDYVIWDPSAPVVPPDPPEPPKPVDQLVVLIGSWVPESNQCRVVAENLEMVAKKIEAGELSSPDMIMASLTYANRKDQVGSEWAPFGAKIANLMVNNSDWAKIFKVAAEVCYEAAKIS